jgi:hypothetical protein
VDLPRLPKPTSKKSFRELTDEEFIALIGMTISPETLKPGTVARFEYVGKRRMFLVIGPVTKGGDFRVSGSRIPTNLRSTKNALISRN